MEIIDALKFLKDKHHGVLVTRKKDSSKKTRMRP